MMKKLFLSLFLFVSFLTCIQAQTTIYSQNFTTAPADWTASGSPITNFAVPTTASPVSGGNAAGKTAAGTTPAGGRFLTKTTDVSTVGYSGVTVSWYGYSNTTTSIASPANMSVDFSTNGGTNWTTVTFTQLTTTNTWTSLSATLPAAADGQPTLRIRFTFKSFVSTSRYYIDDVSISGLAANQYYSKATGDLNLLSSWTDDPTGVAGTSPANFTANNMLFNVRNGNPGTLSGNLVISGTGSKLQIESGNTFSTDATNSYTGTVDVNSGGTLNLGNVMVPALGTLGSTSTVNFISATSQSIPVATYGNLGVDNGSHTLAGSVTVPGTLTLNTAGTLAIGDNNTLTISGTLTGAGKIDGATFADVTSNPSLIYSSASSATLNVGMNQHFRNLTISNAVTLTLGTLDQTQIEINNLLVWGHTNARLSLNGNGLILEGDITGAGEFIGSTSSYIAIYNSFISTPVTANIGFVTTASLSSLEIYGRNVNLSTNLAVADLLALDDASLTIVGTRTINIQDLFVVSGGASLVPGTSTFTYSGAVNPTQTVAAVNYNNLTISGTRTTNTVTLEAGTIGITGTYSCTATFTTGGGYDVTGNTVDFNGTTMRIGKTTTRQCVLNNIIISSGTLTDITGTSTAQPGFRVKGDFMNNATFVCHATNPVIFDGTGDQEIGGASSTTFNNLTTTATASRMLSVTAPVSIVNDLTITGPATGTFTVDVSGNVTLKSTSATATARIAQILNPNNVTLSGDFIVERYVTGGYTGYALLGSPGLTGRTFADWDDDIAITCPTCPDGDNAGGVYFTSVYSYSETVGGLYDDAARYVELPAITDPMNNAQGYWVYFGNSLPSTTAITLDVAGPAAKGDVAIPLTLTGAYSDDHGWNLIANPYASPISWTSLRNGNASVDNEIQVYNTDLNGGTGGYATYSGGVSNPAVGSGGIGDNIPMGQGFYVHTHANVSLTAQESNKTATRTDVIRLDGSGHNNVANATVGTVFRLAVEGVSTFHDETAFHFHQDATTGWDQDFDATKWNNTDVTSANISSTTGGYNFAINGLPALSGVTTIPVKVKVGTNGTYTIIPLEINNLPMGACVMLHDNLLNADHDLRTGAYSCAIATSETGSRFVLTISLTNTLNVSGTTELPTCSNMANGALTAVGDNSGPWNYYWKDASNNIVQSSMNLITADTLHNVGTGVYTVDVVTVGSCDNGSQTFTVGDPAVVQALFTAPDTVYLTNGIVLVNFTDASASANAYTWDFGDGSDVDNTQSPSYSYTNAGYYTVTLMAYNTVCGDSSEFQQMVTVLNPPSSVGLLSNVLLDKAVVLQDQNEAYVRFNSPADRDAVISVSDVLGKELVKPVVVRNAGSQTVALGLADIRNQVLFITISENDQKRTVKIVKN